MNKLEAGQVLCSYLKKQAPSLQKAPMPGLLGEKILKKVSVEGWDAWLTEQTKLLNEYRLNPMDKDDREKLYQYLRTFLSLDAL